MPKGRKRLGKTPKDKIMALDDRQNIVTKTFTREQLLAMSPDDLAKLVGEAGANVQFKGKAVVRKADGTIRYDANAVPGEFGESAEDMAVNAKL
jgi:hypothetical protein